MYSTRKIPETFQKKPEKPIPASVPSSTLIAAKEKTVEKPKQHQPSPLAALLLLELFSAQKKDG